MKLNNSKIRKYDYSYWNHIDGWIFIMEKPIKIFPNKIIESIRIEDKHKYKWV